MDRLIAANSVPQAQADIAPATGTPQFATDGNPASNSLATRWPSYQYNAIQEELIAVLAAAAITPDRTNNAQLIAAIKALRIKTSVQTDTGAANAYAAANATPLTVTTWVDGVVQVVKIAHTNTTASTYSPDGLAAIPIYGLGLQPLQQGELIAGGTAILMHATIAGVNGGNPIAVLMGCFGGAQQVAPATQSQHAVNLGQFASSISSSGYQKLPNGWIFQWGQVSVSGGATASVTFPIAFPTACRWTAASPLMGGTTPASGWAAANIGTKTGCNIAVMSSSGTLAVSATTAMWLAIGN